MSVPFISEIRMVGFNFAPRGWAFCDGQILLINQNQALFSLLGTTYGGDGRTTFALPDMRGRMPVHKGSEVRQGSKFGQVYAPQSITTIQSIAVAREIASNTSRANVMQGVNDRIAPYIGISFTIALTGVYPSRS
ncbi:MAG: microcystin-dependent protein [Oceanicoccus sp.]|jgi:microcystin-dependent protein